jgi:hypothetical protein
MNQINKRYATQVILIGLQIPINSSVAIEFGIADMNHSKNAFPPASSRSIYFQDKFSNSDNELVN